MTLFMQVYLIESLLLWVYPCDDQAQECVLEMLIKAGGDNTTAGPIFNCMNTTLSKGESIELKCTANEPPDVNVIFNLRGRERAWDNYTLELSQIGSSYWEVQGNASSCQPIALNVQGLDSGDYRNFTCVYTNVEDKPQQQEVLIILALVVVVLVVVVLVILLFTFVGKLYRERKKRQLDPPEPPSPVHRDSEAIPLLHNSRNRDYEAALLLPNPNRSNVEAVRDQPGGVSATADTTFMSSDSYPQRPEPLHEPVESNTSSDDASST